jgi:sulfur-oxidizing protein SoxY
MKPPLEPLMTDGPTRRQLLVTGGGLGLWLWVRPASAASDDLQTAIQAYTGGVLPKAGRVKLDIAPIVDNGNTVPITVSVDSPMTAADHVTTLAVFNERNPQREVFKCQLGPHNGRAEVATRIRLATTQKLVAVARMSNGSWWSHTVEVIVAIAACIEEDA